jgi:6-pyruvoyltetrahydropterin/6-carboxytetrahydropterin synthase
VAAPYRIEIARELFKFSCAHMTVFPDGTKERLHGHNYYMGITVELADISFDRMIPFAPIKEAAASLCGAWKEHTLLAAGNPYLQVLRDQDGEIEFRLCGERYVLPRKDVLVLPVDNVTVEALAAHAADVLIERLGHVLRRDVVLAIEVQVTESPGQGAVCRRALDQGEQTR